MDRCSVRRVRRLAHRFGHRWMRVNGAYQLLHRALEPQRAGRLSDKLGRSRTDHMHAQDFIVFLVGDDLHEAVGLTGDLRPAQDAERKRSYAYIVSALFGFALGEAHAADLRIAVGATRYVIVVERSHFAAGDTLRRDDPLGRRDMRELRMPSCPEGDHVTDGGNRWDIGLIL